MTDGVGFPFEFTRFAAKIVPGAFLRSRCWPSYFDPTSQNREFGSSLALVCKLLAGDRKGRSLKALGGHPPRYTNVGQTGGRYGQVVRSKLHLLTNSVILSYYRFVIC